MQLTFASYNIHKAVGLDRRRDPDRILAVLREIDADVIAGYDMGMFRVEGELGYKRAKLDDTTVSTVLGGGEGDFDADGVGDLAVGAPYAFDGTGKVIVYSGRAGVGLSSDEMQMFSQGSGTPGYYESGDHLGWSLAAGDLDGDLHRIAAEGLAELLVDLGLDQRGATAIHLVADRLAEGVGQLLHGPRDDALKAAGLGDAGVADAVRQLGADEVVGDGDRRQRDGDGHSKNRCGS